MEEKEILNSLADLIREGLVEIVVIDNQIYYQTTKLGEEVGKKLFDE